MAGTRFKSPSHIVFLLSLRKFPAKSNCIEGDGLRPGGRRMCPAERKQGKMRAGGLPRSEGMRFNQRASIRALLADIATTIGYRKAGKTATCVATKLPHSPR